MGRRWSRTKSNIADFVVEFPERHKKLKVASSALVVGFPVPMLAFINFKFAEPVPTQASFKAALESIPWVLPFLWAWPIVGSILTSIFGDWLRARADTTRVATEELETLLTAIEEVEGKKMHRFAEFARKVERDPPLAKSAFLAITQPESQLETIVLNLHNALKKSMNDPTLTIVLAEIRDGKPHAWKCQMPNDVFIPDSLKADEAAGTLFAHAAQTKKAKYLEDIEQHLSGKGKSSIPYVPLDDPAQDCGSIICIPVNSEVLGRVLYVLSIKSDRHDAIHKNFEKRHKLLVKAFKNRLLLEGHLEVIRRHAEA